MKLIGSNRSSLTILLQCFFQAKRQTKATSFSEDGTAMMAPRYPIAITIILIILTPPSPSPGLLKLNTKAAKNLRRSRAAGRGLPKKGRQ